MYYVYVLESLNITGRRYIGFTGNVEKRLKEHNEGKCASSKGCRPWRVETYVAFSCKDKALSFERYLKTGSGWSFSTKRF